MIYTLLYINIHFYSFWYSFVAILPSPLPRVVFLLSGLTIIFLLTLKYSPSSLGQLGFCPTAHFLELSCFFLLMWWMFGAIITGSTCIFNGRSLIASQGLFQSNLYILFNQKKSGKLCGAFWPNSSLIVQWNLLW